MWLKSAVHGPKPMGNRKLIPVTKRIRTMRTFSIGFLPALLAAAAPVPRESPAAAPALSYSDTADLALAAPVVAHVRLAQAIALKKEQAAGVRPGWFRYYVEADTVALIRAPRPLPARVNYVVDLPAAANGKAPRIAKGSEYLVLAAPAGADGGSLSAPAGADRGSLSAPAGADSGSLRLVAPDAQLPFSPGQEGRLRAILQEAGSATPPPRITGVGRAFHVRGSLPGESETQIFLQTADGRPVSLSVLRRPGETARWSVALSEIVDEAAAAPRRDTLLWYRLACGLPRSIPPASLAEDSGDEDKAAIRADYRLVLDSLGPCGRTRAGS
jgi:hypothetical protein